MSGQMVYKSMSKIYDLLDVLYFKNNDRNPRRAMSNFTNHQEVKVLDICTGTAANAITIAKQNSTAQIVGIDISQEMLDIANNKIDKNGIRNIQLFKMDATKIAFPDEAFDVILISLVLHEIPENVADKMIREAKRLLKPDGKLLVMEWEEPQRIIQRIWFYLIKKTEPKGFEQFLKKDLKQYLNKFQLEIIEIIHSDYTKVLNIKHAEPGCGHPKSNP